MLRKFLLLLALGCLFLPSSARAQAGIGVGFIAGEPSGFSLKTWLTRTTAFDAVAAWSFEDEGSFHAHGDYLVHNYEVFRVGKGALPLYYGVGGRIRNNKNADPNVGIRFPVGIEYLFSRQPLDLFLEVVPVLDLTPESNVDVNASFGARFFFH